MVLNLTNWSLPALIYTLILSGVIILLGIHIYVELYDLIKNRAEKSSRIWKSLSVIAVLGLLLQVIMSTTPLPGAEFTPEMAIKQSLIIGVFLVCAVANVGTVKVIFAIIGTE